MQDQVSESFSLDWIQSFEFGQEFEEVYIDWSTKIAPLWTLIINNLNLDTSFDYSSVYHCLLLQALPYQLQQQQLVSGSYQQRPLIALDLGQTSRLHNTLYITSLVSSHYHHGPFEDAEV